MTTDQHTVGRWLCDRARTHPSSIAIDDHGVTIDYATLHQRAHHLSEQMVQAGHGSGARVATLSGSSTDHVVAFFACALAGSVFVPLSWRLTPVELAELVGRSDVSLLVYEEDHAALARATRALLAAAPPHAALGATGVEHRVPAARSPRSARPVTDDDPLLVTFTSGSQSSPKGVVLTHANCFWTNIALGQAMPLDGDDVVLSILPQFHVAAWNVQPLLAWSRGATVVLERSFEPRRVLRLIEDRRVTAVMGVPTQYRMLLDSPQWETTDLSSLRTVLVGGATTPAAVAEEWHRRGVTLNQGYGLTEAGPNVLVQPGAEYLAKPGSVGRPYPFVDVRLVDPATDLELAGPATGELWVRGPSVFAGYLDDPEATAAARSGPWLRTGDLAQRDADGTYRIIDRLKEMYISGGENIAPAEVEEALLAHPLVRGAGVAAVPDDVWGERGFAFVEVRRAVTTDELMTHLRGRLASFKLPVRIVVVEELPRLTIEKIDRSALRTMARDLITPHEEGSDVRH